MDRAFEAPDLIAAMDAATNYNGFLVQQLADWARGANRLLDFGAGNGRFAIALQERGFEVSAIEPDSALRDRVQARAVSAYASLATLGDLQFDGIYTINVLEHIEDDLAILERFHELVRPGGRIFIYVPAFPILFSANDERVGHVRRYTKRELLSRVVKAGFQIEKARYVDSLGFAAGLAYRMFGNREGDLSVQAVTLYDRVLFPVSRAIDRVAGRFVGKNLLLCGTRPSR